MTGLEPASLAGFGFLAGVATFFAPCAYPLLPGYVSYYLGHGLDGAGVPAVGAPGATPDAAAGSGRAVTRALRRIGAPPSVARGLEAVAVGGTVSAGFLVVYGVLTGIVVVYGGQAIGGVSVLELVVGVLLIVLGALTALDRMPAIKPLRLPARRRSVAGFFGFGVVYAAAAAGCTAPLFVGVALRAAAAGPGTGLLVIGAYTAGMSALMVGVTLAAAFGRDALVARLSEHRTRLRRGTGVLLVLAGVVEVYFFLFRFDGLALLGLGL